MDAPRGQTLTVAACGKVGLGGVLALQNAASFAKRATSAGVVELADASDSKSEGTRSRAGSIPASGTNNILNCYMRPSTELLISMTFRRWIYQQEDPDER